MPKPKRSQRSEPVEIADLLVDLKQLSKLDTVIQRLDKTNETLTALTAQMEKLMSLIDDLTADVADERTVIDSAVTLLGNLSDQLAAAGNDPVKLAALKDAIDANKATLAAAVVKNTPAAPAP